jgi:hypothetical protein
MELDLPSFEEGVRDYWREIGNRSSEVQERERAFPELAVRFAGRKPPHFTREDLVQIIHWKYDYDCRKRDVALAGLQQVPDDRLLSLTSHIGDSEDVATSMEGLFSCQERFGRKVYGVGKIHGVGIAGVSAILTAARPDLFAVVDILALTAINHHYSVEWVFSVPRDKKGMFVADWNTYPPYVGFCRGQAARLTAIAEQRWTPRQVDMALWAIGKKLPPSIRLK